MAAYNRDKILRTAEKLATRGRLEAAIKEYGKILSKEADSGIHNTVGDLYRRLGKQRDAISHWIKTSELLERKGFYVKAIAVQKKIQRADPSSLQVRRKLAELYAQQGLVKEARDEFQNLIEHYLRQNDAASAINVYQRLIQVEPQEPSHRARLADLYVKSGLPQKAVREYANIAKTMADGGAPEQAIKILLRALEMDSSDTEFVRRGVIALRDAGANALALEFFERAIERNPDAEALRTLLPPPPSAASEPVRSAVTPQPAPPEAREEEAPEPVQEPEALEDSGGFVLEDTGEEEAVTTATADDRFETLAPGDDESTDIDIDIDIEFDDEEIEDTGSRVLPPPDMAATSRGSAFAFESDEREEIDLDLVHDLGVEPAGTVVDQEVVEDPAALAESNRVDLEGFDLEELEEIEEELPAVSPSAATPTPETAGDAIALGPPPAEASETSAPGVESPEPSESPMAEDRLDLEDLALDEIDLDLPAEEERPSTAVPAPPEPQAAVDEEHEEDGEPEDDAVEIPLAPAFETASGQEESAATKTPTIDEEWPAEEPAVAAEETGSADESGEFPFTEVEPSTSEPEAPRPTDAPPISEPPVEVEPAVGLESPTSVEPATASVDSPPLLEPPVPTVGSPAPAVEPAAAAEAPAEIAASTPSPFVEARASSPWQAEEAAGVEVEAEVRRVHDLLAEAEVFVKYGLQDKAVDRLREVLSLDPSHLGAATQLVRLQLEREEHREVAPLVNGLYAEVSETGAMELWRELKEQLVAAGYRFEGETVVTLPDGSPPEEEVAEGASAAAAAASPVVDLHEVADAPARAVATPVGGSEIDWLETPVAPEAGKDRLFEEEEQLFDLGAALQEELEDDSDGISLGSEEQSLEEIIEGFKKGVSENLSPEDSDTHYNLGIAYREMMLLDEAIGEFQIAARDPAYLVDCCAMLGLCFREKGLPDLALRWYRKGLDHATGSGEQSLGMMYEMANAYLELDDRESAYKTFVDIYDLNTDYRDVADRMQQLSHPPN